MHTTLPIGATFRPPAFGVVTDPFDVTGMINTLAPAPENGVTPAPGHR